MSTLAILQRQEEFTMRIAIGIVAIAAMVAGCTASSSSPEQAMQPAAGEPLTYDAHTMGEFDNAKDAANKWCRTQHGVPAHYVDRTYDKARFECG